MGDCKDCKGDCTPSRWPVSEKKGTVEKIEISDYLKSKPELESNPTALDERCTCDGGMSIPRYMCLHCIRSFVQAVSIEKADLWIGILTKRSKLLAAERVMTALKEKKIRELEKEKL